MRTSDSVKFAIIGPVVDVDKVSKACPSFSIPDRELFSDPSQPKRFEGYASLVDYISHFHAACLINRRVGNITEGTWVLAPCEAVLPAGSDFIRLDCADNWPRDLPSWLVTPPGSLRPRPDMRDLDPLNLSTRAQNQVFAALLTASATDVVPARSGLNPAARPFGTSVSAVPQVAEDALPLVLYVGPGCGGRRLAEEYPDLVVKPSLYLTPDEKVILPRLRADAAQLGDYSTLRRFWSDKIRSCPRKSLLLAREVEEVPFQHRVLGRLCIGAPVAASPRAGELIDYLTTHPRSTFDHVTEHAAHATMRAAVEQAKALTPKRASLSLPQIQELGLKSTTRKNVYYCDTCMCDVFGDQNWALHLGSEKHRRREVLSKAPKALDPTTTALLVNPRNFHHCKICGVVISGEKNIEQHLAGSQHRSRLQLVSSVIPRAELVGEPQFRAEGTTIVSPPDRGSPPPYAPLNAFGYPTDSVFGQDVVNWPEPQAPVRFVIYAGPFVGKTTMSQLSRHFEDIDALQTDEEKNQLRTLRHDAFSTGDWSRINAMWRTISERSDPTKILLAHGKEQIGFDHVVLAALRVAVIPTGADPLRARAAKEYASSHASHNAVTPYEAEAIFRQCLLMRDARREEPFANWGSRCVTIESQEGGEATPRTIPDSGSIAQNYSEAAVAGEESVPAAKPVWFCPPCKSTVAGDSILEHVQSMEHRRKAAPYLTTSSTFSCTACGSGAEPLSDMAKHAASERHALMMTSMMPQILGYA